MFPSHPDYTKEIDLTLIHELDCLSDWQTQATPWCILKSSGVRGSVPAKQDKVPVAEHADTLQFRDLLSHRLP